MKNSIKRTTWAGLAAIVLIGSSTLLAQPAAPPQGGQRPGRGNFDPEQARQMMAQRMRERFEVKDDAEWKIIQERIEKVTEARRATGGGMGMGMGMMGRRGGGPGGGQGGGQGADANQPRRGFGGGEPSPEAEALQKALDGKASNDELKAKLASLREARKAGEAKLAAAQDELRKVLSVRQEAEAVLMGMLK